MQVGARRNSEKSNHHNIKMPGTNNPTEEELELVTAKIIEIANVVTDDACMLEPQGYFDECGFDIEARGNALNVKLKEWSQNAEDVEPLIEDHPQPRRMARYLLENVDYAVLAAPLSAELLKKPTTAVKPAGGVGGLSRNRVMLILAVVILLICLALLFALWPAAAPGADAGAGSGGGGGHTKMGRIRKGGGARRAAEYAVSS